MDDDVILNALAGETLVHQNALASVTTNCVVVREALRGARVVISIDSLVGLRKLTTTHPGLLVISCGLFTIAAASYASKQGLHIAVPIGFIGMLFVMGYLGTRRAAVLFLMENESIETLRGSLREAASVIRAVERVHRAARARAARDSVG
jgi:hypothetical protein